VKKLKAQSSKLKGGSKFQVPNGSAGHCPAFGGFAGIRAWRCPALHSPAGLGLVLGAWCFLGVYLLVATAATNDPGVKTASRNIGIEGQASLVLPRADYQVRPLDDRTELILRIDSVTATNGQHRYQFYYMGLEPGSYQLADFLIRPDGSRPDELAATRLNVRALLPEDHDGQLNAYVARPFPFVGGYRVFLGVLAAVWVAGFVVYRFATRKKVVQAVPEPVVPEPTFAERLRPLVEAAAAGRLSVQDKAALERLLMAYWRDRLNLPALRMTEALAQLKAHTEAGELLRALERWLHRPGGVKADEVNALLQPYGKLAAPAPAEGATA
jgi:hypothetical protein